MSSSGRHSRVLWGPGDGLGAYKVMPKQYAVRCTNKNCDPPRPLATLLLLERAVVWPRKWALPRLHTAIARTHENAGQLVKHPVLGRIQALEVLLGACKGEQPSSYMGLCAERRRRVTHREPCWMKPLGRKRTSAALADTWRRPPHKPCTYSISCCCLEARPLCLCSAAGHLPRWVRDRPRGQ